MSKVDRLLIQGIRSFDPNTPEVIKVLSPLTLIVGTNGSGKTTIIECLRFISTGELPPNSAIGGAWIHDPKLCGENEVLAKVKMSFFSPSGQYMIIDRKLQVTVKNKSRSQKTLDGTLSIKNKSGEETTISSRVAELDQLMPQYLGVPKAILDSVIFCHQDDSLWPMSTPAMLKKKFDEIFEAQKYSKAVDQIKLIKKQKTEELGKMQIEEKYAKAAKGKGAEVEKKMEDLFHRIEDLRERHTKVGEALEEAIQKSKESWDHAAKYEKILSDLHSKRMQSESIAETLQTLSRDMKTMHESDEELQNMQLRYEDYVAKCSTNKAALERQWSDKNTSLLAARDSLGKKQTEVGMFKNAMQQYERQVEARKGLVKETAARHQIRGFDLDITDAQVEEFAEIVRRLARDQKAACARARQETQAELSEGQAALNALTGQRTSLAHSKGSMRSQIDESERKVVQIQHQVDAIDADAGTKAVLEANLRDLNRRLQKSKVDIQSASWNTKLEEAEHRVTSLTVKKESLETEQAEVARHAADLGQLDYLTKELKDRQRWLDTNAKSYDSAFRKLLQDDWSPSDLETKYRNLISEREESVKNAGVHRDRLQRDVEQHAFKLNEACQTLDSKQAQLANHAAKIRMATEEEPSEFPDTLRELEDSWGVAKSDQTSFSVMKDYYQNCIGYGKSKGQCRLCERKLKDEVEKNRFIQRIEKTMQDRLKKWDEDQEKMLEEEVSKARSVRGNYDTWVQLSVEIPDSEKSIKDLEKQRDELNAKLEAADENVRDHQSRKREAEALSKAVQNITKSSTDITNYRSQIKELEGKQQSVGAIRSTTAVQENIQQVNQELRSANAELSQIRTHRERAQTQLNSLELDVRDAASKLSQADHQLMQKTTLENQIADYKAQTQKRRDALKQTDIDIQALAPQISQALEKVNDITHRGNERDRELQADLVKTKDSISRMELASQDINNFISRGGPMMLARGTREMESIGTEIKKFEADLLRIGREVKNADDELQNTDNKKRAISDNLQFRSGTKKLQELKLDIATLESSDAAKDKDFYSQQGEEWQVKRNQLSAEQATISGELRTKDDQFQELSAEWNTEYKDAVEKFRKAHVNVEVTKLVVEDLGRYAAALDKAIMKYHSIKMEDINRIIEELWRKTYRGSDVDTILIRSDHETQRGNKSYNYRVVMVKQDAEMDMRGRCSAGQKVLASIIIRLALAECFSVNCGLIALDEPTTNLDRDNIRSLAMSLNELIKVRRAQANFQLIVITHDEEFLRYMNCAELCDEYFRVSRNDRQKSQIVKQSISEVYR